MLPEDKLADPDMDVEAEMLDAICREELRDAKRFLIEELL